MHVALCRDSQENFNEILKRIFLWNYPEIFRNLAFFFNENLAWVSFQISTHYFISVQKSRSKSKFVNTESREQRLASAQETNNKINRQYMNKSSSSTAVNTNSKNTDQHLFTNRSNVHLNDPYGSQRHKNHQSGYFEDTNYFNHSVKSTRSQKPIQRKPKQRTSALTLRLREVPLNYSSRKSLLNVSSVSIGKISEDLTLK